MINREVLVSKVALISTNRQQLKIFKELKLLTNKHLHKVSRNVYFVSVVNMNSFYFYNNKNLSDMHYENYICHTAAFQRGLQGFLAMNRLKVCTLLSFMEQLKNTGPPLSSSACVLHVCPRILQVQNKHTKWIHMIHDSKVYTCSDINLGKFLFHYVMFCDKENRDLSCKIYHISFSGIS